MSYSIWHLDTERTWRGGQQQLLYLATHLKAQGHRNTILCPPQAPLATEAAGRGLEIFPLSCRGEWDLWSLWKLRRWVRDLRPQVLHAHSGHAVTYALFAACGNPHLRCVAHRRVDFPLSSPLSRIKYSRMDRILSISQAVRRVLEGEGLPQRKIRVVHSAVDLKALRERAAQDSASLRQKLGVEASVPIVGQVGALVEHKDPLNLLRAILRVRVTLASVHLVYLGEGPLRGALEKEILRCGLQRCVHLMGFSPRPFSWMREMNVAVLSSRMEGLGTSLLEAMGLGVPVVATEAGGIPEMLVGGRDGLLVPPKDPERLGEAILKLLQNPDQARLYSQRAAARAEEFSVEKMGRAVESIYEEILSP
ncbi:MAG: glycosyltransferase [Elusimicrobia bacterium]|nr:glycosyltransferase [Elusimicrobiota bacterium]